MTGPKAAHIDGLPSSLVDIAEALGVNVAIALIENFGGLEVKFPVKPRLDHPVIKALGETDGLALCQYLSGQAIYVPHNRAGSIRADVRRLEAGGYDRGEIARRLRISQRHVRRIANRSSDDRQGDLFD